MMVSEMFAAEKIDRDMLIRLQDESILWKKAVDFILENWDKDADKMTIRQTGWMINLLEDVTEKRTQGWFK